MKLQSLTDTFMRFMREPTIARDLSIGVTTALSYVALAAIGNDLSEPQTLKTVAAIAVFFGLSSIPPLSRCLDAIFVHTTTKPSSTHRAYMM